MTREEALTAARAELARRPVDPDLWEELRRVFHRERESTLEIWMIGNSGWLRGGRPIDVWRDDPEAVLNAARKFVAPWG